MKKQHQRGPLTERIERQYGVPTEGGVLMPAPRGVVTDSPGNQIHPSAYVEALNVEYEGNRTRSAFRYQLASLEAYIHDANARIHPQDFRPGSPFRLWYAGEGCPGESLGTGFFLGHYDPEQYPNLQRAVYYSGSLLGVNIAPYGGQPMVSVDLEFRQLNLLPVPWGTENIAVSGVGQDVLLADLSLAPWSLTSVEVMYEFDGLYFIVGQAAGGYKVLTWDGRTIREDDSGTGIPTGLGLYRDSLILGFTSAANKIRIRERGESPGTWRTVTPGAGTVACVRGLNSIRSYRDNAYIVDGPGGNIWKYTGATDTLAIDRTLAADTVSCLTVGFGRLYFGWVRTSDGFAKIGMLDGVTYTDLVKDMEDVVSLADDIPAMEFYRNSIVVVLREAATTYLTVSDNDSLAGSNWENHANVGIFSNNVFYMVPM